MTRTQSVMSRTILTTTGMAVQGVARLVYTVVIGRFASEGALGDTSALLSVAVYLSLVLPAGLGVAASRYLPVKEFSGAAIGILNRWFWSASAVLSLLSFPLAFLITKDPWASTSAVVLVWTYSAYVYTRGVLMGEDRILRATIADTISSLLAITALVLVLFAQLHWALLLPLAFGYALFAYLGQPLTASGETSNDEKDAIGRFVRDATVGALATGGLLPATMIFVRAFDTALSSDLFAAALSLATPASMISQAVNQVLIPHFSRIQDSPKKLRESSIRLTAVTTLFFAVVFGIVIWLAPFILSIIYGTKFVDGAVPMQLLLVIVFLISATCAPSAFLMVSGQQRLFAMVWLFAFILGTATMFIAAPQAGMWGALLGFAIGGGGGSLSIILIGLLRKPRAPSIPDRT